MPVVTFGSLPIYKPQQGKRLDDLTIIYPHKSEFGPAKLFGSAIAANLRSKGTRVRHSPICDVMERGPKMRRVFSELNRQKEFQRTIRPGELLKECDIFLTYQDMCIRARRTVNEIDQSPVGASILEVHAMPKVSEDNLFNNESDTRRVAGTSILVHRLLDGFSEALENIAWHLEQNIGWFADLPVQEILAKIGTAYGFDLEAEKGWLIKAITRLSQAKTTCLAIEVPGERLPLHESHPNFKIYGKAEGDGQLLSNERLYCAGIFKAENAKPEDVTAVASILTAV